MRKITAVKVIAALGFGILFTASAASAGNLYVKADLGYNMLEDSDVTGTIPGVGSGTGTFEYDAGIYTSGAVGYDFGMFRLDGEIGYGNNDVDKLKARGQSFEAHDVNVHQACVMANAYFDMDNATILTPYAGVGVGFSNVVYEEGSSDWDDTVFAYQLNLGLAIEINQMVDLDLAYRYFATSDPTFEDSWGNTLDLDYSSHIVMGGVKLNF